MLRTYRVFVKYCVFSLKFGNFSELCHFCCSAGDVLPAWCVYTHLHRDKTEKGKIPENFKILQQINKNLVFQITSSSDSDWCSVSQLTLFRGCFVITFINPLLPNSLSHVLLLALLLPVLHYIDVQLVHHHVKGAGTYIQDNLNEKDSLGR